MKAGTGAKPLATEKAFQRKEVRDGEEEVRRKRLEVR